VGSRYLSHYPPHPLKEPLPGGPSEIPLEEPLPAALRLSWDGMRLALAAITLAVLAAGCGSYDSRSLDRSLPRYPGARFVSRTSECGPGNAGGTVCSSRLENANGRP
jgi:hypothetical protein